MEGEQLAGSEICSRVFPLLHGSECMEGLKGEESDKLHLLPCFVMVLLRSSKWNLLAKMNDCVLCT